MMQIHRPACLLFCMLLVPRPAQLLATDSKSVLGALLGTAQARFKKLRRLDNVSISMWFSNDPK